MAKYRRLTSAITTRRWFNVQPRRVQKINRNAPCPCGSGKKYKKCCGVANIGFWEKLVRKFRKKPSEAGNQQD